MNERQKLALDTLSTGVPDLDAVLGGGLPEYSFNIIAGTPGTGKTTLAHQMMFANATPERPALYFTVLGEPTLKMLRYQQQFDFFDIDKVEDAVRFINLSDTVLENDLGAVLERIQSEVEATSPGLVLVDSFRTLIRKAQSVPASELELQAFVQRLALYLTSWQATTFLIGEYSEGEIRDNPVFTVADGLFWLYQSVERNSVVRKLQVMKLRGQASMPGLHTFRITEKGVQVFPRTFGLVGREPGPPNDRRLSTGVAGLDEMLGGGIPAGDSVLIAGPSGSGKSALATQFLAEGARQGEPGVITIFEERPQDYVGRADGLGLGLQTMIREGALRVLYLRPLDLSVDEALREVLDAVETLGARRVVIDSMNGFELALAPAFREDFRESLYRMIMALTGAGVTVLTTVEVMTSFTDLRFSPHAVSFLSDDIILQRYIEIDGQIRRILMIVKMRGSGHSQDIREYKVGPSGLVVGERLTGYQGLITGTPHWL
ncbi:MAG: AAA family ATPase [Cytophagales bacterium]|nr:AAA family ATPase [Armatimonadota bacterium]